MTYVRSALDDWEQQHTRAAARALTVDRHRFELLVRGAQGDPGRAPVQCAGFNKGLDLSNAGATTTAAGVTRCGPCRHRALGR